MMGIALDSRLHEKSPNAFHFSCLPIPMDSTRTNGSKLTFALVRILAFDYGRCGARCIDIHVKRLEISQTEIPNTVNIQIFVSYLISAIFGTDPKHLN